MLIRNIQINFGISDYLSLPHR